VSRGRPARVGASAEGAGADLPVREHLG